MNLREHIERAKWYRRTMIEAVRALEERRLLSQRFRQARIERGVELIGADRVVLGSGVLLQRGALVHGGGKSWSGHRGAVTIGEGSTISHGSILWGAGEIVLGRGVAVGPGCILVSSTELSEPDPDRPGATHRLGRITLEDGVRLYAGVVVTQGVTIGRGATIAANATVLDDVPAHELWGGTPARRIRALAQAAPR